MCPAGIIYNTQYDFINWFQMPLVVPAVKPVFKQTKVLGRFYKVGFRSVLGSF